MQVFFSTLGLAHWSLPALAEASGSAAACGTALASRRKNASIIGRTPSWKGSAPHRIAFAAGDPGDRLGEFGMRDAVERHDHARHAVFGAVLGAALLALQWLHRVEHLQ